VCPAHLRPSFLSVLSFAEQRLSFGVLFVPQLPPSTTHSLLKVGPSLLQSLACKNLIDADVSTCLRRRNDAFRYDLAWCQHGTATDLPLRTPGLRHQPALIEGCRASFLFCFKGASGAPRCATSPVFHICAILHVYHLRPLLRQHMAFRYCRFRRNLQNLRILPTTYSATSSQRRTTLNTGQGRPNAPNCTRSASGKAKACAPAPLPPPKLPQPPLPPPPPSPKLLSPLPPLLPESALSLRKSCHRACASRAGSTTSKLRSHFCSRQRLKRSWFLQQRKLTGLHIFVTGVRFDTLQVRV
jgi:hypothetical protein